MVYRQCESLMSRSSGSILRTNEHQNQCSVWHLTEGHKVPPVGTETAFADRTLWKALSARSPSTPGGDPREKFLLLLNPWTALLSQRNCGVFSSWINKNQEIIYLHCLFGYSPPIFSSRKHLKQQVCSITDHVSPLTLHTRKFKAKLCIT